MDDAKKRLNEFNSLILLLKFKKLTVKLFECHKDYKKIIFLPLFSRLLLFTFTFMKKSHKLTTKIKNNDGTHRRKKNYSLSAKK